MRPGPALKPDRATLGAYSGKLEAYFNDHFGFRKRLIYGLALAKVQGLGVTSTPGVTLGRKRLAVSRQRVGRAVLPRNPAVRAWAARSVPENPRGQARLAGLAGIPYLLIIPPNKDTIYPEFMPAAYNKLHSRSRLDQLLDYMKDHSSVVVLDIREDLFRAKQIEPVYDVTDSHWNSRGAFIAYQRIMQALSDGFPRRSRCRDRISTTWWKTAPAATSREMLGIADRLPEAR